VCAPWTPEAAQRQLKIRPVFDEGAAPGSAQPPQHPHGGRADEEEEDPLSELGHRTTRFDFPKVMAALEKFELKAVGQK
jgi:hypothetical protein